MNTEVAFSVNGVPKRVETPLRRTLLEVLREDLGLTGTKYGCGEGECRSCTVLVNGRARPSCQVQMSKVSGAEIVTIEGLSDGEQLHPVQQAFIDEHAMQCGYCVPGMILNAVALLDGNPRPTEAEIVKGMNGNLCRCCNYINIIKAVQRAGTAT